MSLSIGSLAPQLTLKRKTAEGLTDVRLSDHFGKEPIVLLFFPLAFTGVCTDELCSVTNDWAAYKSLSAKVYGISVDSPFSQEAWCKQNHIEIPILSDFNREAIQAYDVVCKDLVGLRNVAKRSAFVINKEGVVTFSWSSEDPKILPNFDDIKKALSK